MQPSAQPSKTPSAATPPAKQRTHTLDVGLDLGAKEAKRARNLRCLYPTMERLSPPALGRFWVIGGLPGTFKTKLAWNMALNMALMKQRVLFVSLEMTTGDISLEAAARFSGLPTNRIIAGLRDHDHRKLSETELAQWDEAQRKILEVMLYLRIHDAESGGRELRDVLASARQHRYDAVFVDHLGMIGRDTQGDEFDKVKEAAHALRALSRGEGSPDYRPFVCATSQLNRDGQKQQKDEDEPPYPKLSDFRGTSRIEYDSDVAIVLQKRKQPDPEQPSIVDAFVLKNRQGPCPLVLQFEANGAICMVTERHKPDAPPRPWNEKPEDDA